MGTRLWLVIHQVIPDAQVSLDQEGEQRRPTLPTLQSHNILQREATTDRRRNPLSTSHSTPLPNLTDAMNHYPWTLDYPCLGCGITLRWSGDHHDRFLEYVLLVSLPTLLNADSPYFPREQNIRTDHNDKSNVDNA